MEIDNKWVVPYCPLDSQILCHGEDGYNFALCQVDPITGQATSKKVSAMDFYAYRTMVRPKTLPAS